MLDEVEGRLRYPLFVKPANLGSSVGITKATDRASLARAIEVAAAYDRRLLVEEGFEGGIEVNCSVLGNDEPRASVCEQPVRWTDILSYEDKYLRGGKGGGDKSGMAAQDRHIPAPISDELTKQVQDNALRAFAAIGAAGVARIDSFVDEETGDTWVMEINTVPGSFAFYLWEASGVPFGELVGSLVDSALKAHEDKGKLMFSFDSGLLAGYGGGKTRG